MNESLTIHSTVALNNGSKMPLLGIGVAQIPIGKPTEDAVHWALDAGYRHIDTAKQYQNEVSVGKAIKNSSVKREDIWVTAKLWTDDFLQPYEALGESLERLGLDYVDLYLVHWPTPTLIPIFEQKLWQSLERMVGAGLCRSIGVSNYQIPRLQSILAIANITPAVNQVRCSPFSYPAEVHNFCKENDIAFEAYSPMDQGRYLNNPQLIELATQYHKSPAQIMLRWGLEKNIVVIPKSQNKHRIEENADLYDFALSAEDMAKLDALTK